MDEKEISEKVEQIVKHKRPKRSEQLQVHTDPGDNTKYLLVSMKLAGLPKIDLHDSDAVQERLIEYFQIHADNDMKPTVAGMGLALGVDRRRLWEIKTGQKKGGITDYDLPTATLDVIKRAYEMIENMMENYMQNGKINPVSGIFLMKNNFGYQDKTECVLTPNTHNDSDYDAEDIRKRYLTDSTTIDSTTIDSTTIDSDSDSDS